MIDMKKVKENNRDLLNQSARVVNSGPSLKSEAATKKRSKKGPGIIE